MIIVTKQSTNKAFLNYKDIRDVFFVSFFTFAC